MDKLVSPRKTAYVIKKFNLRLSKKYGQNFLIDENILLKIIEAGELKKNDKVLEVGPGIGTLTQVLSPRVERVAAVEIDRQLIPVLQESLEQYRNVSVVQGDILKMNLRKMIFACLGEGRCKVISNLPYNIAVPLISTLIKERQLFDLMLFMVQKEVAQRITASTGKKDYGAVSVLVQNYAEAEILFKVPKKVFLPPPEVESAVIKLRVREQPLFNIRDEGLFYKVVRGSFQHRRKSLVNSLSSAINMDKEKLVDIITKAGLDSSCRGETLSIREFANLTNIIYNYIR